MDERVEELHIFWVNAATFFLFISSWLLYVLMMYIHYYKPKITHFRRAFLNEKPFKIDDRDWDILFIENRQDFHNNYARTWTKAIIYRLKHQIKIIRI